MSVLIAVAVTAILSAPISAFLTGWCLKKHLLAFQKESKELKTSVINSRTQLVDLHCDSRDAILASNKALLKQVHERHDETQRNIEQSISETENRITRHVTSNLEQTKVLTEQQVRNRLDKIQVVKNCSVCLKDVVRHTEVDGKTFCVNCAAKA